MFKCPVGNQPVQSSVIHPLGACRGRLAVHPKACPKNSALIKTALKFSLAGSHLCFEKLFTDPNKAFVVCHMIGTFINERR